MRDGIRIKVQEGRDKNGSERRQRGQSLVEAAVFVPILIMLLAAAVDFGRIFDAYIVLTNAAREGARFGAVNPMLEAADVEAIVVSDVLGSGTNITQMTEFNAVDNVFLSGHGADSTAVTVRVTYDFPLWFGGIVGIDRVTLSKTAVMPRWFTES